jgi:hypothetical protein
MDVQPNFVELSLQVSPSQINPTPHTNTIPTFIVSNIPRPSTAYANSAQSRRERPMSAHNVDSNQKPTDTVSEWGKLFYPNKKKDSSRRHEIETHVSSMQNIYSSNQSPHAVKAERPNTARPSKPSRPYSACILKRPMTSRPQSHNKVEANYKTQNKSIKPKIKINTKGFASVLQSINEEDQNTINRLISHKIHSSINEKDILILKNHSLEKPKPMKRPQSARPKKESTAKERKEIDTIDPKSKDFANLLVINSKFLNMRGNSNNISNRENATDSKPQPINKTKKVAKQKRPQSAGATCYSNQGNLIRFNNAALDFLYLSKSNIRNNLLHQQQCSITLRAQNPQITQRRIWSARSHKSDYLQNAATSNLHKGKEAIKLALNKKDDIKDKQIINEFQATLPSSAHKYPILHSLESNSMILIRI